MNPSDKRLDSQGICKAYSPFLTNPGGGELPYEGREGIVHWEPCRKNGIQRAGDLEQAMSVLLGLVFRDGEACMLLM